MKERTIYNSYNPAATSKVIWYLSNLDYRNVLAFLLCLLISFLVLSSVAGQAKAEKLEAPVMHFPLCTNYVATDAPNPTAIYKHENWHCWNWQHPVSPKHPTHMSSKYRAHIAPWYYRILGEYPNKIVYFELSKGIAEACDGALYGCAWGGLLK